LLGLLIGFANSLVFSLFLTLVLFLALFEFYQMGLAEHHRLEQLFAALVGSCIIPLLHFQQYPLLLPLLTLALLILSLMFLLRLPPIDEVPHRLGWIFLGLVYLPFLLGHLVLLRQNQDGREWIFLTLLVIMGCDSFAYFVGSNLGKRKLYPAVSPNKSVEGGIGGVLGSILAVFLCKATFLPVISITGAVGIGLLLGVVGQLGDLFESLLKRACGVKDSGKMIPGHGGLLDRLDSLLFAFPLVYYIAHFGYGG